MLDINGKEIIVQQYLKITGCNVKGDNGIYIVDKQYEKGDYCLYKVLQNGELSRTKYNIYFLDDKHDINKQVTIISKEELQQASKEVKEYINNITNNEIVYSFTKTAEQEIKKGLYINIIKHILLVGHINKIGGRYEITDVYPDGKISLHMIGERGEKIADNMNGYYQFMPIHLNFKRETVKQLLDEGYIEILGRNSITKGELKPKAKDNKKTVQKTTKQPKIEEKETVNTTREQTQTVSEYDIKPDVDTRDNSNIFVVKVLKSLSKDEYIKVNQYMKSIGGYYSKFKKGFLFKTDPTSILSGANQPSDINTESETEAQPETQEEQFDPVIVGDFEISQEISENKKVFVVKVLKTLYKSDYKKVNEKMQSLGGSYNKYLHGFVFLENPIELLQTETAS